MRSYQLAFLWQLINSSMQGENSWYRHTPLTHLLKCASPVQTGNLNDKVIESCCEMCPLLNSQTVSSLNIQNNINDSHKGQVPFLPIPLENGNKSLTEKFSR